MFENTKPSAFPLDTSNADHRFARGVPFDDADARRSRGGDVGGKDSPLRAFDWSELSARLNAARDLRQLLREDAGAKMDAQDLEFAHAATQFFRTSSEDEHCVNPNALEASKTSPGTYKEVKSERELSPPCANEDSTEQSVKARCEPGDVKEEQ